MAINVNFRKINVSKQTDYTGLRLADAEYDETIVVKAAGLMLLSDLLRPEPVTAPSLNADIEDVAQRAAVHLTEFPDMRGDI